MIFETAFGRCAIVELADDAAIEAALATLPADERTHAATLGAVRRRDHVIGRCALHAAIAAVSPAHAAHAIPADARGAPVLPAPLTGSISHKLHRAAAIAAADRAHGTVGIDLEQARVPRGPIGERVLTARELAALATLAPDAHGRAITLRFAIKEAIYKAVDPWVQRYVGFREVELEVGAADAPIGVTVIDPAALPVAIEARWRELDGHWLAIARATPR